MRPFRGRTWMWLGLGMGLLSGCGSATKPLPPQSAMLPRIMDPLPIAGHATSVLQAQGQIWVAVQTGHGLSVKPGDNIATSLAYHPNQSDKLCGLWFSSSRRIRYYSHRHRVLQSLGVQSWDLDEEISAGDPRHLRCAHRHGRPVVVSGVWCRGVWE